MFAWQRLVSRAAICAALALATTGNADAKDSDGAWTGVGVQMTADRDASTWTVSVTFIDGGARVSYPSLGCAGRWTREGARYREHITSGDCIDGGLVSVTQQAGKLFLNWTVAGQTPDIAASAVLFSAAPVA